MIVVTDTSVILNLCFLKQDALLKSLFGSILAPREVKYEFQRLAKADSRFKGLVFPDFIEIVDFERMVPALQNTQRLHAGECAAISLAVEQGADAVLMDERAGRDAATALKLTCIGLLGVLLQAKRMGLVARIGPLLLHLQDGAKFWISPGVRRKVLQLAGEVH